MPRKKVSLKLQEVIFIYLSLKVYDLKQSSTLLDPEKVKEKVLQESSKKQENL